MSENQAPLTPTHTLIDRVTVLGELWADFKKLKQIYHRIGNKHESLTPELKYQVYVLQVRSQVGKSILFGLKEVDLDDLRVDVEELKKAVMRRNE